MDRIPSGRDMTRGPLTASLFAVAWPIMLSFLLETFYNLADAFWLGRLGKSALVAPTVTMNVFFLALSLAMGLGTAGTTLVSQYRGAGRLDMMGRAGGQALVLMTGAGFTLMAIGLALAAPILHALQTPGDAFAGSLAYLRWTFAGMPFVFVFFVFQGISTGMGDTIGPLRIKLFTVVLNAALDPLLIFGWGPVPAMGVAGAALATAFSQALAGTLGLRRLLGGGLGFRLQAEDLRWDRAMIARLLKIGVPMSLGQSGTALGFTLLMGIVNSFGSAVTAAFGIGNRIITMVMIPAFGLSQASATAVGQNLGADQPARAGRAVRQSAILIAIILLPLTTLMFFFGDTISRIFIADPEVTRYGRELFRITSYSVFAFGFIMVLLGAFQGSGHTVPVMVLNMSRLWLIRVPAAYLLAVVLAWGPAGLWWGMFLSNTLIAIAAGIWFAAGTWKRKVIDTRDVLPAGEKRARVAPLGVED